MNMEKEEVSILVDNEILIEQGKKVLESVEQVEFLLGKIRRIGNRIHASWKGEAGECCYERIYEIIQQTERATKQMEEYAREVQKLAKK